MAFDSTLSGTASNSYIPVATADSYFQFHLEGISYWNTAPVATKQAALVQATNRLDMELFGGRPTTNTQYLQWPRTYIVDRNKDKNQETTAEFIGGSFYRPSDKQPKELENATCEMALHLLKVQAGVFTVDENDLETLKSMKIGPIDVTIKDNLKADRLPTKVRSLLSAIGPNGWYGDRPLSFTR